MDATERILEPHELIERADFVLGYMYQVADALYIWHLRHCVGDPQREETIPRFMVDETSKDIRDGIDRICDLQEQLKGRMKPLHAALYQGKRAMQKAQGALVYGPISVRQLESLLVESQPALIEARDAIAQAAGLLRSTPLPECKPRSATPKGRIPPRDDLKIEEDNLAIRRYLEQNPGARRDDVAIATGIAAGNVSKSDAWDKRTMKKKDATAKGKARGLGEVGDPTVDVNRRDYDDDNC